MTHNTDYAALILRVGLGAMFVAHGLHIVTFAEIGGGVLLIAGVAVRAVSLALIPVLLGATFVHAGYGWVFSSPNGGWEYPAFLTLAAVVQALLGPGAFALKGTLFSSDTAELSAA
jgi:putative oxidoreductase